MLSEYDLEDMRPDPQPGDEDPYELRDVDKDALPPLWTPVWTVSITGITGMLQRARGNLWVTLEGRPCGYIPKMWSRQEMEGE